MSEAQIFRVSSLFSAYAEVFLVYRSLSVGGSPFLCLRRGVSTLFGKGSKPSGFSLPTQRCFFTGKIVCFGSQLFSAYAEVFPSST